MLGIIDVGGGTRDIYGAGVFDYLLDEGIKADYCIGVSAGSINCAAYLGGHRGKNYRFYMNYAEKRDMGSVSSILHTGAYLDLDGAYDKLEENVGETPIDIDGVLESNVEFKVVATNASTGKPVYFRRSDMEKYGRGVFLSSCCTPVAARPYVMDGTEYFDGAISDPIPLLKALRDGCDKIILILTKPTYMSSDVAIDEGASNLMLPRHLNTGRALRARDIKYKQMLRYARDLWLEGKVLVIAPDGIGKMRVLTKDMSEMELLYLRGYYDAREIKEFIHR